MVLGVVGGGQGWDEDGVGVLGTPMVGGPTDTDLIGDGDVTSGVVLALVLGAPITKVGCPYSKKKPKCSLLSSFNGSHTF